MSYPARLILPEIFPGDFPPQPRAQFEATSELGKSGGRLALEPFPAWFYT